MNLLNIIINLYVIIATKSEPGTLKTIQSTEDFTSTFNNILMNEDSDINKSVNVKENISTILDEFKVHISKYFKCDYYEDLEDTISENVSSLQGYCKFSILNTVSRVLQNFTEDWKDKKSILEEEIELAFVEFNSKKDLIKKQVYEKIQEEESEEIKVHEGEIMEGKENLKLVEEDEDIKISEKGNKIVVVDEIENFFSEEKDRSTEEIEIKVGFKEKDEIVDDSTEKSEKDEELAEKEKSKLKKELEKISFSEEKNELVDEKEVKKIEEKNKNSLISLENESALSFGRTELKKALDNMRLGIHNSLEDYKICLYSYVNESHIILTNYIVENVTSKGNENALSFILEFENKLKGDLNLIFEKYENEIVNCLLN